MAKELTTDDIDLVIDDDLHKSIPAQTDAEAKAFRESVDREGRFLDAIKFACIDGLNLVLDGRHRIAYWNEMPDDKPVPPPPVEEIHLPDRAAARVWILRNELGHRHLAPKLFRQFVGELYNEQKKPSGRPKKPGQFEQVSDNETVKQGETAEQIAEEHDIDPTAIRRCRQRLPKGARMTNPIPEGKRLSDHTPPKSATVYTDRRKTALALNSDTRKLWPPLFCGNQELYIFANTQRQMMDAAVLHIFGDEPIKPLSRDQRQQLVDEVLHEMAEEVEGAE